MIFEFLKCMLLMHACCSQFTVWHDFQDLDNWNVSPAPEKNFAIRYEPYDCPSDNAPCLQFRCGETDSGLGISTSVPTDHYKQLEISFDWQWYNPNGNGGENITFYYSCGLNNVNKVKVASWAEDTGSAGIFGTEYFELPQSCDGGVVNIFFNCYCQSYTIFYLRLNFIKLTANYKITSIPTTTTTTPEPTAPAPTTRTSASKEIGDQTENTGYIVTIIVLMILLISSIGIIIWMKLFKRKKKIDSVQLSNQLND